MAFEVIESFCRTAVFAGAEVVDVGGPAVGAVGDGGLTRPQLPIREPLIHRIQAMRIIELRRQHRRHPETQLVCVSICCESSQDCEHALIGAGPRLVQPLLADGPSTVIGEPREMRVQDQGEHAGDGVRDPVVAKTRFGHGFTATNSRSRLLSRSVSEMSKSAVLTPATSAVKSLGQA